MTQRTTRNGWTNRIFSIGLLLLLAACANGGATDQHSARPGVNIADAALDGGMPQTALDVTRTILQSDPHNVDALERQGIALTQLNQPDAAMEAYQRALAVDPAAPTALLGLGRLQLVPRHSDFDSLVVSG
jgi:Flp pilus assembly protein TadD